jgi:hypothetical protein
MREALQVLSPPYLCSRRHVWAGAGCFLACLLLLKAKRAAPGVLQYAGGAAEPDGEAEAAAAACLRELSMLYFGFGWLDAAAHTCLWAVLENEAADLPARARVFAYARNMLSVVQRPTRVIAVTALQAYKLQRRQ